MKEIVENFYDSGVLNDITGDIGTTNNDETVENKRRAMLDGRGRMRRQCFKLLLPLVNLMISRNALPEFKQKYYL